MNRSKLTHILDQIDDKGRQVIGCIEYDKMDLLKMALQELINIARNISQLINLKLLPLPDSSLEQLHEEIIENSLIDHNDESVIDLYRLKIKLLSIIDYVTKIKAAIKLGKDDIADQYIADLIDIIKYVEVNYLRVN